MNLPRYVVCDALNHSNPAYGYAFFIRTQLEKLGVPPLSLWVRLCQYYDLIFIMKPDGRRANHIIVEKS